MLVAVAVVARPDGEESPNDRTKEEPDGESNSVKLHEKITFLSKF